jgi:hypothetical protein
MAASLFIKKGGEIWPVLFIMVIQLQPFCRHRSCYYVPRRAELQMYRASQGLLWAENLQLVVRL